MIDPSVNPQVKVSISALKRQQETLGFYVRFCCLLAVREGLTYLTQLSRNSLVLMNYITQVAVQ